MQEHKHEPEMYASDHEYLWLLAEVQRVKRQHKNNQVLFACDPAMDSHLISRRVFGMKPVAIEGYHFTVSESNQVVTSSLELRENHEHPCWPKVAQLVETITKDNTMRMKIRKRVVRWALFVTFADLVCGYLALRKPEIWDVPVSTLGLHDAYSACVVFALRVAYLREISLYRSRKIPRVIAMTTMLPLAALHKLPFLEFRHGATSPHRWLAAPTYVAGERGLHTPEEFRKRLTHLTFGIFDGVDLAPAKHKYRAYLCGSCVSLAAMKSPIESFSHVNKYYRANTVVASKNDVYIIKDSCSTSSEDSEETVKPDRPSRRSRMIRYMRRMNRNPPAQPETDAMSWLATPIVADIDVAVECNFDDFDAAVLHLFAQLRKARPNAQLQKVITENKHKYIVRNIERDVDLFHVDCAAYVVSKFHLDCVRCMVGMEANNKTQQLFCHPSFMAAAHTSMNVGMRWSSNKKDPRCTVIKYLVRGWGTYLSFADMLCMAQFVGNTKDKISMEKPLFANMGHYAGTKQRKTIICKTARDQYKKRFDLHTCDLATYI